MCGRFTLTKDTTEITQRWQIDRIEVEVKPRYNIAPTQNVLIVTDDGERELVQMRWGLIPSWAEDPNVGNHMINARAETVAEKPSFRDSLKKRRCLVLADGFYEWQKLGTVKQPVHIVLKSREVFGFAGLWDTWESPDGQKINSCTIITTTANELLKPVHDRMPAILDREAEDVWLDPLVLDSARLLPLLKPYPPEQMEFYPVSQIINSPTHDSPTCLVPASQSVQLKP